jgi:hypothetical protein
VLQLTLADIETLFDLLPSPLTHIWSYRCDGYSDPIPYVQEIQNLFTIQNSLDVFPQKSIRVRYGILGGKNIFLPLQIQALRRISFKIFRTKHLNSLSTEYIQNNFDIFSNFLMLGFYKDHWEDQGVGGWTILEWILER